MVSHLLWLLFYITPCHCHNHFKWLQYYGCQLYIRW